MVVTRKTALEELVERLNSRDQASFYLQQNGVAFSEYEAADAQYQRAVAELRAQIPSGLKRQFLDRSLLPTYQFGDHDLVVTLGPDGLVVNVAKYLAQQPILALNPDPARVDGVLIPFRVAEAGAQIERARRGVASIAQVFMAQAQLNDGQVIYAVNDLFIGTRGHGSARYTLELEGRREQHSSSGIIISTGAGCTGWLRSVVTGAWQVVRHFDDELAPQPPGPEKLNLGWESERLWFSVREPFVSKLSRAELVFGQIDPGEELVITSQMPDNGLIFSDGIESDYLSFNAGLIARVRVAERKAHLITRMSGSQC
ncbi:MAG: NAD(+)/NADH kinase [Roseiflexaceae bacterium]